MAGECSLLTSWHNTRGLCVWGMMNIYFLLNEAFQTRHVLSEIGYDKGQLSIRIWIVSVLRHSDSLHAFSCHNAIGQYVKLSYLSYGGETEVSSSFITFLCKYREEQILPPFKGALDKCNIYLFMYSSIEDLKLHQYQNFQLILPLRFHFMRYFVNSIIFKGSHRLLYCVFIEFDFEK